MFDSTKTIKRLSAVFAVTVAVTMAVPFAAQAWSGPPDAIDRYNSPVGLGWDGPPDAIDRYKAHQAFLARQSRGS